MKKLLLSPVTALSINIFPVLLFIVMAMLNSDSWALQNTWIVLLRLRIAQLLFAIWALSGLGGLFHLTGVILSICYLCRRGKTPFGVIISVISIIFPFVLWFVLIKFFGILSQFP